MPAPVSQRRDEVAAGSAVVGDEHADPRRRLRPGCLEARAPLEARGEGERAVLAGPAHDADAPAHEVDQARCDGQAETGPLLPACRRRLGLLEGGEDQLLLVARDPDTRIAHGEAETLGPVGPDPDDDLA